jgi:hypothetical protein
VTASRPAYRAASACSVTTTAGAPLPPKRALKRKEARALVVAKLDRLSRSVQHFARFLDLAQRQRWALVALDPSVDMTQPSGRMCGSATPVSPTRRLLPPWTPATSLPPNGGEHWHHETVRRIHNAAVKERAA